MTDKNLEDIIQRQGSILPTLRNSKAGMYIYPGVAPEFSNWRDEQRAWRESAVLFDQSHHMHEITIEGPDAFSFLQGLAVNTFSNFDVNRGKQFIAANPDGQFIGDMIGFRERDDQFVLVGREVIANWVEFNLTETRQNVRIRRDARSPARPDGKAIQRQHYRFQIQGPQAWQIIEKINAGPVPEIKFFHIGTIMIGTKRVRALRHGMAGAPGLEIWGPADDKPYIRGTILQAARDLGIDLRQVGSRAYPTNTLESGWIPNPLPAVYTGDGIMKRYRQWLAIDSYEASGALSGSFDSAEVTDYYVTPYDMGYGNFVNFDHEFIGREALMTLKDKPHRRKVTFEWNGDDVVKVVGSFFRRGEENYKWIEFPWAAYAATSIDKILLNDQTVGMSLFTGYSYNERCVLSLGLVEPGIEDGDVLTMVWGDPDGGAGLASVEHHRQTEIRVRVCPAPYARQAREQYADGWRTRQA
jgi:vanillate/3-O-methylgallate O-demethylase